MSDRENRIRERAFALWQEHGSPHGRDQEHWEQACREIEEEDSRSGLRGAAPSQPQGENKGARKASGSAPSQTSEGGAAEAPAAKRPPRKTASPKEKPSSAQKEPAKRKPRSKN
ncbi:DUF2934 domain-containing protein [Novosphingobium sp. M1R2S20]|uniref:DUF2934 domain-containing protein n=1 Tax=Novosphingobium rhizovicinum TaxID=3228928 RepID=A0ABV3R946_9SPHN